MSNGLVAPAALVLALLPLAGCGAGDDVVGADPGPALGRGAERAGPAELALQVTHVGGFLPATAVVTRLPLLSVYDDGRVITEGRVQAIFPGPALPNVLVRQVDEDAVDRLVDLALAAGVGEDLDFGQPPVADAPTTRFTVATDGGTEQTDVYALSEAILPRPPGASDVPGPDPGLSPEAQDARAEFSELLSALTDLEDTLGADAVGQEEPYEPEAVAVVATPWVDPGEGLGEQPELAWPGPALPGEPLAEQLDLSCLSLTGEDAERVLDAAADATTATPWVSGGERWSLVFRPLLPHESGCEDLRGQW